MVDTAFLRSDELPGRAALGYLAVDGLRTNVLHLPVLRQRRRRHLLDRCRPQRLVGRPLRRTDRLAGPGRRDGATAQRLRRRSPALRPRVLPPRDGRRGWLEGYDAGVSFTDRARPASAITYTVISNWSDGAWPIVLHLDELFAW